VNNTHDHTLYRKLEIFRAHLFLALETNCACAHLRHKNVAEYLQCAVSEVKSSQAFKSLVNGDTAPQVDRIWSNLTTSLHAALMCVWTCNYKLI